MHRHQAIFFRSLIALVFLCSCFITSAMAQTPEPVQQIVRDQLAAQDANRAGQCRRQRHDDRRGACNVVATRGGEVAHRDNNRLAGFAQPADLAPDDVRGHSRASG